MKLLIWRNKKMYNEAHARYACVASRLATRLYCFGDCWCGLWPTNTASQKNHQRHVPTALCLEASQSFSGTSICKNIKSNYSMTVRSAYTPRGPGSSPVTPTVKTYRKLFTIKSARMLIFHINFMTFM